MKNNPNEFMKWKYLTRNNADSSNKLSVIQPISFVDILGHFSLKFFKNSNKDGQKAVQEKIRRLWLWWSRASKERKE